MSKIVETWKIIMYAIEPTVMIDVSYGYDGIY